MQSINPKTNKSEFAGQTLINSILFLFILLGSVQFLNAQNYAFLKIEDSREKPLAIVSGNSYDGNVYHQELNDRDNGKWQFIPADGGYYYIVDIRHNKALAAGNSYDGRIYHQDPSNRDNAKWKLVEKGDNKFQIVDKKHGKAIVSGNNPDGNLYHQDPGLRSNAIWNITIVDGLGSRPAPKEIVIKEKFLDIKYDINERVKDNNSSGTTTLSNKYINNTSLDQSQKITASTETTETNSWENSEEVSNEVWVGIETSFSYSSFGATSAVKLDTGFKNTQTTRKSKANSAAYKVGFSFETNTVVPKGSTTVCQQLITRENANIPYVITVLRTYGDGSTEKKSVPGVWRGAVYARSEVTCDESPKGGSPQTTRQENKKPDDKSTDDEELDDEEPLEDEEPFEEEEPFEHLW